MSSKTSRLPDLAHAPTTVYLPSCPNGCGEMLALDDGWYCPICYRFRSYPKEVRA